MGIDAILAIGGLVLPPLYHLVKGWFLPDRADDPESTMSTLATTKPETLGPYVDALARYTEAQVKFFNRDVAGIPAQWVVNLRAVIRPGATAIAVVGLLLETLVGLNLNAGTRGMFIILTTSWFGTKLVNGS